MTDETPEGETDTIQSRWWLTNDLLAVYLLFSFPIIVVASAASMSGIDLSAIPQTVRLTYLTTVGVAVAWTFGRDAVEAWRASSEDG